MCLQLLLSPMGQLCAAQTICATWPTADTDTGSKTRERLVSRCQQHQTLFDGDHHKDQVLALKGWT